MADNVAITEGSGATIAANEIGGVKYQRVKLSLGAAGTAVDAGAGAGAVGTDTQRVTLASDDPAVAGIGGTADAAATAGGTGSVSAKLRQISSDIDAIKTAIQIIDDWDETDRAAVNLIASQTGVAGGAGNVSAATLRTVLATDVALPAGTNAIGKLAANSGVDIGDVDVTTMPGTAAEAAALPAVFTVIAGDDGTDTQPIQLDASGYLKAVLQAGTAAFGKLAANSGVDIGDVDVTSLPALAAGTNAIGKVGHDTTGIAQGVKTVSTAGTDEALASSTACKWVVIQAQTDNTNPVAVGASGVDATVATGTGVLLFPGDSIRIDTDNLADIYVDALTNGEGVRYTYGT